ncbi:MAG: sodium-translocating pyrophosphatase [Candidatus Aenigmarchaeota archaeon]|nr:sodium-translocating pyrophosphatase [Candidatus Aenigmarchaeota archaeon]
MVVLFAFLASAFALLYSAYLIFNITSKPSGSRQMIDISDAIKNGANAYLFRQYKTLVPIIIILSVVLFFAFKNWITIGAFLLGAALSGLAGYIGMNISVRANVRTAEAAKKGLASALNVAFRGGSVTGLVVAGLALFGVTLLYYLTQNVALTVGFGFGASLISLFMRVGGGIYTKAADVGTDLVGKIEKGIPEDDPRNPGVIADNVGDNVGDCAGMAADLFESYAITLIAAMLLGISVGGNAVLFPLAIGATAIGASVIGTFFVRLGKSQNIWNALYKGVIATAIIAAILFYFISTALLQDLKYFFAALVGLAVTIIISNITEFYTARDRKAVKEVAEASKTGAGTNVIAGLALGMRSTYPTAILIVAAIFASYYFAGVYGIAIAALGMLSVTGMIVAVDSYGPITDNAGGIAEMANLPPSVRKITDALDAVGNTTKAVTKGFAIGSAALAALSLFAAYAEATHLQTIDILKVKVVAGLILGGMIPFLFSSFLMRAVGRAAFSIVEEVRRQFRTIKGLMQGKAKPDYARCVDITTTAALREFVVPGVIAIIAPLAVGFILGPEALGGMLAGSIVTGLLLAITMSNAGAAWDNAKKFIEAGNFGGKGSDAHKAAIVGDTVGDPYKDTAGPSLNPLIKVMNMVALLAAGMIVAYTLF